MDQRKIGSFLKELRKENGLTQEQLAEKMNVSGRTVSRWETGSNMPDLDILIELSDLYDVDIRELLDGERKSERMDQELKETIEKVADYSNEMKKRFIRNMHWMFLAGVLVGCAHFVLTMMDGQGALFDFCKGCHITLFCRPCDLFYSRPNLRSSQLCSIANATGLP